MVLEKREAMYANMKMEVCIYNLNIKVQAAISKDICYSKVSNVDNASWKLIACLVDNGVIETIQYNHPSEQKVQRHRFRTRILDTDDDDYMDNEDDDAVDIDISKAGTWRRKKKLRIKNTNKQIINCIDDLCSKMQEALTKNMCFPLVNGIDEVSWKLVDCLIEDQILDKHYRLETYAGIKKTKNGSPVTRVLVELRKTAIWRSNDPRRLDFTDKEDGYRSGKKTKNILGVKYYPKKKLEESVEQHLSLDESETSVFRRKTVDLYEQFTKSCKKHVTVNWKVEMEPIHSNLKSVKNKEVHQQDSTYRQEENGKLENDNEQLKAKAYLLEIEKTDLKDKIKESTEEKMTLQREKDKLQLNLAEKANLLKQSESSMFRCTTKLEAAEKNIKELKNIIADLKEKIRLKSDEVIMLYNSIETERSEHELEMKRYREDTLTENQPTTTCTCNRMSRTTNVFNVNIVSSQVSFNENTEQEMRSLIAGNGQHPAIEEDN